MKRIRTKNWVNWAVVIVLLGVMFGSIAIAQRGQGGPGGMGGPGGPMGPMGQGGPGGPPHPMVMIETGTSGVFVLAGCTLVKYDAALKEVGTLNLGEQSTSATDKPPMPKPGEVLFSAGSGSAGDKILIVMGDEFYCIDATTLKVTVKATLPVVEPPKQENADTQTMQTGKGPGGPPPAKAILKLNGQTLYIVRGPQIVAINIADGTVTGQNTLPKPPAPTN